MKQQCSAKLHYMKKRAEFLALNRKSKRFVGAGMLVVAQWRNEEELHIGFTASKKVGGAVQRNRAKRRMRAVVDGLVRLNPSFQTKGRGLALILIAKKEILTTPFEVLEKDLSHALEEML